MRFENRFLKLVLPLFFFPVLLLIQCEKSDLQLKQNLEQVILSDTSSFYYVDIKRYPVKNKNLPIGIFDSGTGGLTVMDAIVNFDGFNNQSKSINSDGILDFEKECFIYLADQANMPYGNYPSASKTDLLKEHIIKDLQFLLGNKYYKSGSDKEYNSDKLPVKAIVVACNTATAYGLDDIENFLGKANLDLKVIGVINAGVKGAFESIEKYESCSIAVMATEGTVLSKGYVNSIIKYKSENGFIGDIQIYQQPGIGLAGAIDGVIDYIDANAKTLRGQYKGPSFNLQSAKIDRSILNRYNFDWNNNKILFGGTKENPTEIQLNSIENYIYYNVVSLLEQIKNSKSAKPLKTIILGCTHYPFYKEIFAKKLNELYNLKENNKYVYRDLMYENIILIDPAINTAKELYEYLKSNDLFGKNKLSNSEFYISVPNTLNRDVKLDSLGNFTYEYKYGRTAGNIQEYIKPVPFSKTNLHPDVIKMLKEKTPLVYKLITDFNQKNRKTEFLRKDNLFLF